MRYIGNSLSDIIDSIVKYSKYYFHIDKSTGELRTWQWKIIENVLQIQTHKSPKIKTTKKYRIDDEMKNDCVEINIFFSRPLLLIVNYAKKNWMFYWLCVCKKKNNFNSTNFAKAVALSRVIINRWSISNECANC